MLSGGRHLIFGFLFAFALVVLAWSGLRLCRDAPADVREAAVVSLVAPCSGEAMTTRADAGVHAGHRRQSSGRSWATSTRRSRLRRGPTALGALVPGAVRLRGGDAGAGGFLQQPLVMKPRHAARVARGDPRFLRYRAGCISGSTSPGASRRSRSSYGLMALTLFFFGLIMPNFNAIAMGAHGADRGHRIVVLLGGDDPIRRRGWGCWWGQQFDGSVMPLLAGFAAFGLTGGSRSCWSPRRGGRSQPASRAGRVSG